MRIATILLATCSGLAVAAAPAASAVPAAPGAVPPLSAASVHAQPVDSCSRGGGPLFGVARSAQGRILARIGRRSLRVRPAPRIRLPNGVYGWSWDDAPACDKVALGGHRGRILIVDLERGRRIRSLSLGTRSAVEQVAWPRPDRLTGLAGTYRAQRLVTVSLPSGTVVASRRVEGQTWAVEATPFGLVVLSGPVDRIGPSTLALARPDGSLLQVTLPRIRAGFDEVKPPRLLGRQIVPGMAVDPDAGRAYVMAADEPLVAEVDLASGAVSHHELGAGAAGAVAVAAKGIAYGAYRTARWVGDGIFAVSGEVTRTRRDWRRAARRGLPVTRVDPYGLRLIRTSDWKETTLNPLLQSFTLAGELLLGMNSDPTALDGAEPTGLVAYASDGRRRFTSFRGDGRAWLRAVAWPYAYVRDIKPRRTVVVDLRTGRTVGEAGSRRPPVLLVR